MLDNNDEFCQDLKIYTTKKEGLLTVMDPGCIVKISALRG
jgi:hypothetical protein